MSYGDALGFLNENSKGPSLLLKSFLYRYNDDLSIEKQKGQYSDITELMLITIKCLVDLPAELKVTVDYTRFYEELKLWRYYRNGNPLSILARLKIKQFYKSSYYWKDKNSCGISRIIPILLANKNFHAAEIEAYKNIIYFSRHPEVILTGLLILRTGYVILQNPMIDKDDLFKEIKNYLMNLQLQQLNENLKSDLTNQYIIQFEKDKIQYLIELDRYKNGKDLLISSNKKLLLYSIKNYYGLQEGCKTAFEILPYDYGKEIMAIAYGFWGMSGKNYDIINGCLKDQNFIYEMGKFLYRLRNYEIKRKLYVSNEKAFDLFKLKKNSVMKHPILNVIKIEEREETNKYIKLIVQTKSCTNTFIKLKQGNNKI